MNGDSKMEIRIVRFVAK